MPSLATRFDPFGLPVFRLSPVARTRSRGELLVGGSRRGIAVRFFILEHMPRDRHHLPGGRHDRHVAVLPPLELAKEGSQRSWVSAHALRGLDQEPSRLTGTCLGDRPVVAFASRLLDAGDEPQVTRRLVGFGKAPDVGERRFERVSNRVVDARQGHQQLNVGVVIRFGNDHVINGCALALDRLEQAKVGVDQRSVERIDLEFLEPGEPFDGEESAGGNCDSRRASTE